jgi:hypothetical protein
VTEVLSTDATNRTLPDDATRSIDRVTEFRTARVGISRSETTATASCDSVFASTIEASDDERFWGLEIEQILEE